VSAAAWVKGVVHAGAIIGALARQAISRSTSTYNRIASPVNSPSRAAPASVHMVAAAPEIKTRDGGREGSKGAATTT